MESTLSARALEILLGDWRGDGGSTYRALAERIRLLVLDGRIPVDTRLPAERDLAERLGLSRTTVTAAYRGLREQRLLHSVRGSGSVAKLPGAPAFLPAPPAAVISSSMAMPSGTSKFPGRATLPVTVTMREITGSPKSTKRCTV